MDDEQNENNGFCCEIREGTDVLESRVDAADTETCTSGLGSCLHTYKRRKNAKDVTSCDQASKIAPDECSLRQRNIILEQICHSLEPDGGLRKFIQDALVSHPQSGSRTTVKESFHSCGHQNGTNHDKFTELCEHTFLDIIMSEKFAQLCNLLLANGIKADKLLDLSLINSRMKERSYESSPVLFHSDIQQIWTKLHKIGTDITALAKCLSDKTMASFREQACSSAHSISDDGRHEFLKEESNIQRADLQVHTCRHCRENADTKNGLICDSCEDIYHISCISPAVKEIPIRSWYCPNCTSKQIESPHKICTACERLNETFPHCTVCKNEVKKNEDYRICGHSFCSNKFYHANCLKNKQLVSYGPCWYCPSCLCRNCLIDKDDDKIVLCDGCDHAYHIYCMTPPRTSVPRGKWFCTECEDGVKKIQKAKLSYESMKGKMRKRSFDGVLKNREGFNKSGGVDMLLNAAKTLNEFM